MLTLLVYQDYPALSMFLCRFFGFFSPPHFFTAKHMPAIDFIKSSTHVLYDKRKINTIKNISLRFQIIKHGKQIHFVIKVSLKLLSKQRIEAYFSMSSALVGSSPIVP